MQVFQKSNSNGQSYSSEVPAPLTQAPLGYATQQGIVFMPFATKSIPTDMPRYETTAMSRKTRT